MLITLTYRESWPDCYGAGGWRIRDADGHFPTFPSRASPSTASQTGVPVHDILDHWVSGFGWTYSDEAKATVMHGLRNGIGVLRSIELLAEDLATNVHSSKLIEFFSPHECPDESIANGATGRHGEIIEDGQAMKQQSSVAVIAKALHRVGIDGVVEAHQRWLRVGLDFSLMEQLGLTLQGMLEEAESHFTSECNSPADTEVEILPDVCRLTAKSVQFQVRRTY
ncbi:hypothetical protein [Thermithiobacillus plumbiphilus]|uniref:Uncharacterized protein n=1 Tax=Thermithiobacillus plumbiphilus TaxID=1729899 RepID=A0ABU9DA48_9PROT